MNQELLALLMELQSIADLRGETYREKAFRKAVAELRKLTYQITPATLAQLKRDKLPGIGQGIMRRIEEFVQTGHIQELEEQRAAMRVHEELSKVLGAGPRTVAAWIALGITSIAALRRAVADGKVALNTMQRLGLRYYSDLNERIPRDEVTTLGQTIRLLLLRLDPSIIFNIAGSYSRGAASSGDIDILVTSRDNFDTDLLQHLLDLLRDDPNFVGAVSEGQERVTFLYKSPSSARVRQIDVLNIRYGSYFAALLYFIGSWSFNEGMRSYAKKHGYRLNQNGLFKVHAAARAKKPQLELVPVSSEAEIFDLLGLKYVAPSSRNEPTIIPK